ncbi:hypothetical protein [Pseudonocardia kujensis]|uniref:hypothetical protein n=1 Tax=Pseudonocardia kujensis TaxID=1128675 RepID=UPI00355680B9
MEISAQGDIPRANVALIGQWDPISTTHQALFRNEVAAAARTGRGVVVLTLDPAPAAHVFGFRARPPLDDVAARMRIQRGCGVAVRATVALTEAESARSGAAEMLGELRARFPIDELVLGARQTLGVGSRGDFAAVLEAAWSHRLAVRRLDPTVNRLRTSDARRAVASGRVAEAVAVLGRELCWARPHDGRVRLPWPAGLYKAVGLIAPGAGARRIGDEIQIMLRDDGDVSSFAWPDDALSWIGFHSGPMDDKP